jgi:hypothetical protein
MFLFDIACLESDLGACNLMFMYIKCWVDKLVWWEKKNVGCIYGK